MRHARTITGLLACALMGCGVTDPVVQAKYPNANSYCNGRAHAECSAAVLTNCGVADEATCIADRQTACEATLPTNKVYNSGKAEACVNAVAAAYGDAQLTKSEIDAYQQACAVLFSGPGAVNAVCSSDADCQQSSGLACVIHAAASSVGTCQIPVAAAGGESCAQADIECAPGFHCGAIFRCDADGAVGDLCSATVPCKDAYKCSSSSSLCEPKLANSSPCTADLDCTSGICLPGTNLCMPTVVLSPSEPFCQAASGRG